jgi:hypothetical protein
MGAEQELGVTLCKQTIYLESGWEPFNIALKINLTRR